MYQWLILVALLLSGCQENAPLESDWPLVTDCNLHTQACKAQRGEVTVRLALTPHPVPVAKNFKVTVDLHGFSEISQVDLDISGVNMYMGYNRVTLTETRPGHYVGQAILAFCTSDQMIWQLGVLLHSPKGRILVPFKLVTPYRP